MQNTSVVGTLSQQHNFKGIYQNTLHFGRYIRNHNLRTGQNQDLVAKLQRPRDIKRNNNRRTNKLKVERGYVLKKHTLNHKSPKT